MVPISMELLWVVCNEKVIFSDVNALHIELTFSLHDAGCCKGIDMYQLQYMHMDIHVTYYMLVGSGLAVEGLVE